MKETPTWCHERELEDVRFCIPTEKANLVTLLPTQPDTIAIVCTVDQLLYPQPPASCWALGRVLYRIS